MAATSKTGAEGRSSALTPAASAGGKGECCKRHARPLASHETSDLSVNNEPAEEDSHLHPPLSYIYTADRSFPCVLTSLGDRSFLVTQLDEKLRPELTRIFVHIVAFSTPAPGAFGRGAIAQFGPLIPLLLRPDGTNQRFPRRLFLSLR
jgi:hypothetical protein